MSEKSVVLEVEGLVKVYPGADDGVRAVDGVSFTVREGEFFTLLGPSGCGKSTTLRCVAGLETTDAGSISLAGRVVSSHEPRTFVPPDDRALGMVFQSYAIWPHMSVFENVAFPLRAAKRGKRTVPRSKIRERVMEVLERVELSDYADRMATKLSGGQQQRLALARALASHPRLLLLDEPLSNLDASLRESMRSELRALQRETGVTTLYVTHDQTEALSMSNRIAVMNEGLIEQVGSPRHTYRVPATEFVATFVGQTNLLRGKVVSRVQGDTLRVATEIGELEAVCPAGVEVSASVSVSLRPEDVRIHTERPPDTPNIVIARVERGMYLGDSVEYHVRTGERLLYSKQHPDVRVRRGEDVYLEFPIDRAIVLSEGHETASEMHHDDSQYDVDSAAVVHDLAVTAGPQVGRDERS